MLVCLGYQLTQSRKLFVLYIKKEKNGTKSPGYSRYSVKTGMSITFFVLCGLNMRNGNFWRRLVVDWRKE
ncbi:hypothetical protein HanXRQr2_Chr04g0186331 [Helianthus annuus]|uniref:Uncharacterized protein n=1 Tax=Helianthus annuus TaxID=4232 RepID=A0A9K3NTA5_HELAN|nr:hypothetical protein HanXRQr2_Chr04g0186331 [Helianthus annuus]KAJ0932985.1 hypothetical protein HanPSC8_Chr04g0179901 [Helianthus annuus]